MNKEVYSTTYSGNKINWLDMSKSQITLTDIAKGLSRQVRFNGQTKFLYSVAQHSVYVSMHIEPELALLGLLHDASEAFMCDISAPLKSLLPDYRRMEKKLQSAIYNQFGLDDAFVNEHATALREADVRMFATEVEQIIPDKVKVLYKSYLTHNPFEQKITPLLPSEAERMFLSQAHNLIHKHLGSQFQNNKDNTACK